MTFARPLAVLLALSPLAVQASGHPHDEGCTIEQGPDDLVARDGDLVVGAGQRADEAIAVRGDVILKRGAVVKTAVSLSGSVRVEGGATVREDAVAVGGDVSVERGGRVEGDAVALGGKLRAEGEVMGDRLALDLALGGFDLRRDLLEELHLEGCVVVPGRD